MKVDFRPVVARDLLHRGSSMRSKLRYTPLVGFDDFEKILAYGYHSIHAGRDNKVRVPRT